jgi:hypothetical protein
VKVAIFGSFIYSFLYRNELHNNFDIDVLIESGMDSNGLVTNSAMEFRGDFVGAIRDRLDDKWKMEVDDADGYLGEFVHEVVVKTKDGKQSFRIQFVRSDAAISILQGCDARYRATKRAAVSSACIQKRRLSYPKLSLTS